MSLVVCWNQDTGQVTVLEVWGYGVYAQETALRHLFRAQGWRRSGAVPPVEV